MAITDYTSLCTLLKKKWTGKERKIQGSDFLLEDSYLNQRDSDDVHMAQSFSQILHCALAPPAAISNLRLPGILPVCLLACKNTVKCENTSIFRCIDVACFCDVITKRASKRAARISREPIAFLIYPELQWVVEVAACPQ